MGDGSADRYRVLREVSVPGTGLISRRCQAGG
jgi:hypothetical protein